MSDPDAIASLLAAVRARADALGGGEAQRLFDVLHPEFVWTSHRGERLDRAAYVANNTAGEPAPRSDHGFWIRRQ